jgi:hypothetical protein
LRDNVFAASGRIAAGINQCDGEQITGNRFVGGVELSSFDGQTSLTGEGFRQSYPGNEYYADGLVGPSGTWVYVLPSEYLPDEWERRCMAHVAVYNWGLDESVAVDLSSVAAGGKIEVGTAVTVRPAQNLEEQVERVFDGSPIDIPMTGWTAAAPIGRDLAQEPLPPCLPEFGAFVLEWPVSGAPPPDPAPQLLEDPGQGLTAEEAWSARDAEWSTSDPGEREQLRLERIFAWRMRSLGRS